MRMILMAVAVVLAGCAGGSLDTPEKRGVAFCSSFAGVMQKMALFRQTGNLDAGDILQIDRAVSVIEPYCTGPTPNAPAQAVVDALDILLIVQLNQGG